MSFVTTHAEMLEIAANELQAIGTAVNSMNAAAAGRTTGVIPAAADTVSALAAAQFVVHAQSYNAISTEAASIHQQFVAVLSASAKSYAATEAANAIQAG